MKKEDRATHAQLAEWQAAKNWRPLWEHGLPAISAALAYLRKHGSIGSEDVDEDLLQIAARTVGEAIRSWSPLDHVFFNHVMTRVKSAIVNLCLTRRTGGIGSRWTAAAGREPMHFVSLHNEIEVEDDGTTYVLDSLTYWDADDIPEGLGDAGVELQRQTATEAVAALMFELPSAEAALITALHIDEYTQEDYAKTAGVSQQTVSYRMEKTLRRLGESQQTCAMRDTETPDWRAVRSHHPAARRHPGFWNGAVSVMQGNPIWSEKAGGIWNDWSWKPQPQDITKKRSRSISKRAE